MGFSEEHSKETRSRVPSARFSWGALQGETAAGLFAELSEDGRSRNTLRDAGRENPCNPEAPTPARKKTSDSEGGHSSDISAGFVGTPGTKPGDRAGHHARRRGKCLLWI